MAEISEAQLDMIAARAEAATAGPWEAFVFPNPNDEDFIRVGGSDDDQPDLYLQHEPPGGPRIAVPEADLDFIAATRLDVPLLVEEIRRLRAQLKG
jgi:hypothetical protein